MKTGAAEKRKRTDYGIIVCADCGNDAQRTGPSQRYCRPCSERRDVTRKKTYHVEKGKEAFRAARTQFSVNGSALNASTALDIAASTPVMPKMHWYRRVEIPFSWAGSKNHIFASTARGHVFMRAESRGMRTLLMEKIAEAVVGVPLVQNKLWLDIFVQKPTARGDAVNFVDMVCDAAKDGILLDDRWFCLRSVDWQIVKTDPKLFVGVGQEASAPAQVCSSCGRLLPFDMFQKNRALPNGIGRNCRPCQSVKRRGNAGPTEGIFG